MTIDKQKLKTWSEKGLLVPNAPAAILALLAEIERIGADRKACWEEFKVQGRQLDQLKAENEAVRDDANFRAIQSLRADCEALRKDAERYRYMRRAWAPHLSQDEADAQTDAAMAKEESQ